MATILKENAQKIMTFLQNNEGDFTLNEIAEALGMAPRSANGTLVSLQRAISGHGPLITREVVEGIDKKVIRLTPEGAAFDVLAEKPEPAADAE